MKTRLALVAAALACVSAARAPAPVPVATTPVVGDYVESRTASVFCGACHYNGERVTTGRDAVLAWHVTAGTWHGTDLAGVRAVAAVACDDNLAIAAAGRRAELTVDGTAAQAAAFADLLAVKCGSRLGTINTVRTGPVTFVHSSGYRVTSAGAELSVQPMPNGECCSQPHLVWYEPLVPLTHRKVGLRPTGPPTPPARSATRGNATARTTRSTGRSRSESATEHDCANGLRAPSVSPGLCPGCTSARPTPPRVVMEATNPRATRAEPGANGRNTRRRRTVV